MYRFFRLRQEGLRYSSPIAGLDRSIGFREVQVHIFQDNRHMKEVRRLLALRDGRLYSQGIIPGTSFCKMPSQPQVHSKFGRIMLMKNSSNTIRNRTRDHPTYSTVPQPTAPPRATETRNREQYSFLYKITRAIF
jgi:hypothetical protein